MVRRWMCAATRCSYCLVPTGAIRQLPPSHIRKDRSGRQTRHPAMACGSTEGVFPGSRPAAFTKNGSDGLFHVDEKFAGGPFAGILPSVLDAVGNTPMIRLARLAAHHGVSCDVLAKCEFLSVGGSVKDRVAKAMVEEAENRGMLKRGDTLIESTSGNTGIGLGLAAAVKGYNVTLTMPDMVAAEKSTILNCLGATVILTPTEVPHGDERSAIVVAEKLGREVPDSRIMFQHLNEANPQVHYHVTAEEILQQCGGHVDVAVMAAGTGGTITGVGRKLKERCPNCTIIGVDPVGSILAQPETLNDKCKVGLYLVEGIGADYVPETLDRSVVDEWIKVEDADAFRTARELIRVEGLLVGGSSGASVWAALQVARKLDACQKCVVVLPDSCRNYMSEFICDRWMYEQGFLDLPEGRESCFRGMRAVDWLQESCCDERFHPFTAERGQSVRYVVDIMYQQHLNEVVVVDAEGGCEKPLGVLTQNRIFDALRKGQCSLSSQIAELGVDSLKIAPLSCSIDKVARLLDFCEAVYFTRDASWRDRAPESSDPGATVAGRTSTFSPLVAVITKIDLLHWYFNRIEGRREPASQS